MGGWNRRTKMVMQDGDWEMTLIFDLELVLLR